MHSLQNNGSKLTEDELLAQGFDDLARLDCRSNNDEVEMAIKKYSNTLHDFIKYLRNSDGSPEKGSKVRLI